MVVGGVEQLGCHWRSTFACAPFSSIPQLRPTSSSSLSSSLRRCKNITMLPHGCKIYKSPSSVGIQSCRNVLFHSNASSLENIMSSKRLVSACQGQAGRNVVSLQRTSLLEHSKAKFLTHRDRDKSHPYTAPLIASVPSEWDF
jgi:hypothetical protein